jgi:aspartate kinase
MIVVKFGGSSLAGPERILAAARIAAKHRQREEVVVVVSAMKGVTDALLTIAEHALQGSISWRATYDDLRDWHGQTLAAMVTPGSTKTSTLDDLWRAIEADLASLAGDGADIRRGDAVAVFSAWGERLSIRLFAAALAHFGGEATAFEDAPVVVEHMPGNAGHGWTASVAATCDWLCDPISNLLTLRQTPVLPGYLAVTEGGTYTTLGRNGSDYSAAIIGAALDASAVYLYSDVAGIHDADPRTSPHTRLLPVLSYDEAASLLAGGARVVHPASLSPLAKRGIPLHLRSSFDPDAPGTDIGDVSIRIARTTASSPAMLAPMPLAAGYAAKAGRPDAF